MLNICSIKEIHEGNISKPDFDLELLFNGVDLDEDLSELRKWTLSNGKKEKDWNAALGRSRVREALGDIPRTADHYVRLAVEKRGWTLRFNNILKSANGNLDASEALRLLSIRRDELGLFSFTDRAIAIAFEQWKVDEKRGHYEAARAKLIASEIPDCETQWDALIVATIDDARTDPTYAKQAMKAVIWQVKRKLFGMPVHDHAMLVLQGAQGGGKSEFVSKFFSPISDMVYSGSFADLRDKAFHELWRYPVIYIDEMRGAERTDVNTIKEAITKNTHSSRVHHSHGSNTVECLHTFVGSLNGQLIDMVKDTTGMRRFAAVDWLPSKHKVSDGFQCADWETVNSTDYLALWHSVDHLAEHPLASVREEWHEAQERQREMDSVEAWLRSGIRYSSDKFYTNRELRIAYSDWCADAGYNYPVTQSSFGRKLTAMEREQWFPFSTSDRANGGRGRYGLEKSLKLVER